MSQLRTVRIAVMGSFVMVAVIIGLSGCFAVPPDSMDAGPTESSAPSITIEDKGEPGTLTFEDGAALAPGGIAQWSDGLIADDGWTLTAPDVGEGSWGYTTIDGTCTAMFWQGEVYDMTATDDRAASDFVIAALLKTDAEALSGKVSDGVVGFAFSENTTADYRFVQGAEPDRSFVVVVRGFAQLKSAVYLVVDCASDQAPIVADEVLSKTAIYVTN